MYHLLHLASCSSVLDPQALQRHVGRGGTAHQHVVSRFRKMPLTCAIWPEEDGLPESADDTITEVRVAQVRSRDPNVHRVHDDLR